MNIQTSHLSEITTDNYEGERVWKIFWRSILKSILKILFYFVFEILLKSILFCYFKILFYFVFEILLKSILFCYFQNTFKKYFAQHCRIVESLKCGIVDWSNSRIVVWLNHRIVEWWTPSPSSKGGAGKRGRWRRIREIVEEGRGMKRRGWELKDGKLGSGRKKGTSNTEVPSVNS